MLSYYLSRVVCTYTQEYSKLDLAQNKTSYINYTLNVNIVF